MKSVWLVLVWAMLLTVCTDTTVGTPELIYPINGEQILLPFTFIWSSVDNSSFYRIEVDRTLSFSAPVILQDVNDTSF